MPRRSQSVASIFQYPTFGVG